MNLAELRQLTEARVLDARVLLEGGRWEFAYYTAGYAIECALKACLLTRMIHTGWVFTGKPSKKVEECQTHNLPVLIDIAGLTDELDRKLKVDTEFRSHWGVVESWTVVSRYQARSEAEARRLFSAISDTEHGVLRWIQSFW